jgi:hypothetical protein
MKNRILDITNTVNSCGTGLPQARGGLLLGASLALALFLSFSLTLSCERAEEEAVVRDMESVSFHLTGLQAEGELAGEIDVWVFTPEGDFLCAAEGRELQSGTDGTDGTGGSLRFTALLPTGRFLLLLATDARSLMQAVYPEGIPPGEKLETLLQTLEHQATSGTGFPLPPQLALMEEVSITQGLTLTMQIVPWTEVSSSTDI